MTRAWEASPSESGLSSACQADLGTQGEGPRGSPSTRGPSNRLSGQIHLRERRRAQLKGTSTVCQWWMC